MKTLMCSAILLVGSWLLPNLVFGQHYCEKFEATNWVAYANSNGWKKDRGSWARTRAKSIEGLQSLQLSPDGTFRTAIRWSNLSVDTDVRKYQISINSKINTNQSYAHAAVRMRLLVNNYGRVRNIILGHWQQEGHAWQKLQGEYYPVSGDQKMTLLIEYFNVKNETILVDYANVKPQSDLLNDGDFELGEAGWILPKDRSNADIKVGKSTAYRGDASLMLVGKSNGATFAIRPIDVDPSMDGTYTLKYHLRTDQIPTVSTKALLDAIGIGGTKKSAPAPTKLAPAIATSKFPTAPVAQPLPFTNRSHGPVVTPLQGKGANISIICMNSSREQLRRYETPYLLSNSGQFHQQELNFVVPPQTTRILLVPRAYRSSATAYFDNIELNNHVVSDGDFIDYDEIDPAESIVEGPEPGTFVEVLPSANDDQTNSIQSAIDLTTTTSFLTNSDFGKSVWLEPGIYNVTGLQLRTGMRLRMSQSSELRRKFEQRPRNYGGAFICNPDAYIGLSDITIIGGSYDSLNVDGAYLRCDADRVVVRSVDVQRFALVGGNSSDMCMMFMGYDFFLSNNTIKGPGGFDENGIPNGGEGFDGIHLFGGARCCVTNNDIYSGDDSVGVFTGTIPDFCGTGRLPFSHRNVSEVEVYNNILDSKFGRSIAGGITVPRRENQNCGFDLPVIRLETTCHTVRGRNSVGRMGGNSACLSVVCFPRTNEEDNPPIDETVRAQVWNFQFKKMHLTADLDIPKPVNQGEPSKPQWQQKRSAVEVVTFDVGSVKNIFFDGITVEVDGLRNPNWIGPQQMIRIHKLGYPAFRHQNRNIQIRNSSFADEENAFVNFYNIHTNVDQDFAEVNDLFKARNEFYGDGKANPFVRNVNVGGRIPQD